MSGEKKQKSEASEILEAWINRHETVLLPLAKQRSSAEQFRELLKMTCRRLPELSIHTLFDTDWEWIAHSFWHAWMED